jgi:glycosyltransferase involved in cell wall biosynthesis
MNEILLEKASEFTTENRNGKAQISPKVAYIMSRFPKISETFILFEMIEQEKNGVHIELYPLLHEKQPVSHKEVADWLPRANFHPFLSGKILRANWHFFSRKPVAYLKLLLEIFTSAIGSLNFFVGALGIFPKSVRFAYEMQQKGVSHVHSHFCNHPAVAAMIINRLTGIPFSFTAHGSDLHVERRMLDKKVKASAFAVTVSHFNKEVMVKACGDWAREKVHVIRCGIDPEVFVPRRSKNIGGPLKMICIASFEEVKGHKYLVEACKILQARNIAFVCDLIGDGPARQQISEQIAAVGLQKKIIIHGPKPRKEVVRMLNNADVKILSSVQTAQGKREGVPVVLMEAMAMALPVVSSQLSGIPELVDDGKTGILVPPCDVGGIAGALQMLYENPDLRRELGHAGREKVIREFNLKTNTLVLADLIRRGRNGLH